MIEFITANWVAIGGVILLIVRVIESVMQMANKDTTMVEKVKNFIITFFKLS
jgi:hypothetical protein